MKENIHPNYREVVFEDMTNGHRFIVRSTIATKEKTKMKDGVGVEREFDLYKLETSAETHPFYTGQQKSVDTLGGQVEKYRNRYAKTTSKTA